MIILAHRGVWNSPGERNSKKALVKAFELGFGIETDLRDRSGKVVISHDPPGEDEYLCLDDLLQLHIAHQGKSVLALNVKADGLQKMVASAVARFGLRPQQYFMFDMAVPDWLGYHRLNLPCFTRHSEIEPVPSFLNSAVGVWMDCFFGEWATPEDILHHIYANRKVALVSPELHGRPHITAWQAWKSVAETLDAEGAGNSLMLCTDLPEVAREFFL